MSTNVVYENSSNAAIRLVIVLDYNRKMTGCWLEKNGAIVARNHLIRKPTESDLYHDGWTKLKDNSSNEDSSNH